MELHGELIPLVTAVPRAVWVVQTALRSQIHGSLKDGCDDAGAATPRLPGYREPKTTRDGSEMAHLSFLLEISSGS